MSVMNDLLNTNRLSRRTAYEHFESIEGLVYNRAKRHTLISSNGFAIEPSRFSGEYKITRFIRDPRDLIVSGYFYHLAGSEPWFLMKNPTPSYWAAINGCVPSQMPGNVSYSEYLQSLSPEEGLLAEIEFRKHHLESMRKWPEADPNIILFKYEDIVGNEVEVFSEIFNFMEFTSWQKWRGIKLVKKYSLNGKKVKSKHIRNPKSGQWKDHFTAKVSKTFNDQYMDILKMYAYDV